MINRSIFGFIHKNIVYTSDPIPFDSIHAAEDPAFTKEKNKYSWQKEARGIWLPKYPPMHCEPWIIHVPNARRYCLPFKAIKNDLIIDLSFSKGKTAKQESCSPLIEAV